MSEANLTRHLACTTKVGEILSPAELEVMQYMVSLAVPNEEAMGEVLGKSPKTVRNQMAALYQKIGQALPVELGVSLLNKDRLVRASVESGLVRVVEDGRRKLDKTLARFTGRQHTLVYQEDKQPTFLPYEERIAQALIDTEFSGTGYLAKELGLALSTVRNTLGRMGRSSYQGVYGEPSQQYVDTRFLVNALIGFGKVEVTAK